MGSFCQCINDNQAVPLIPSFRGTVFLCSLKVVFWFAVRQKSVKNTCSHTMGKMCRVVGLLPSASLVARNTDTQGLM